MLRLLNSPLVRAIGFACVLAHPAIEELAPPSITLTPFARLEQGSCRDEREAKREREQRVPDVIKALQIGSGSVVADVGAGGGFYTVRLARAVGESGRVLAVDIDQRVLRDLRARAERDGLRNVEVVEGTASDPRLPAGRLDAALIVNAYHEMTEYQAMLGHLRRALKPTGRLVILEPISATRRSQPRAAQTRSHEIAPELVLQDAREAGFKVAQLEEPFSNHQGHGSEWLMVLTPAPAETAAPPDHAHEDDPELGSTDLRIGLGEFRALHAAGPVIVLDVRGAEQFEQGRIDGARLAPMDTLKGMVSELKAAGVPIVTYCSCPAEETSARAALYLRKQGISNVRALTGGYEAWLKPAASVRLP